MYFNMGIQLQYDSKILNFSAQLSSVVDAGETLNKAIEQYELRGGKGGSRAPPQVTVYQPPNVQGSTSITASPGLLIPL